MDKLNEKTPFSITERALRIREKRKLEYSMRSFPDPYDPHSSSRTQNEHNKNGNDLHFDQKKSKSWNEASTFYIVPLLSAFDDFGDWDKWHKLDDWKKQRWNKWDDWKKQQS